MKRKRSILTLIFFLFIFSFHAQQWKAPETVNQLKNPYAGDQNQLARGMKIFKNMCVACHGIDGKGDPLMLKTLNPPPADLTSEKVQNQTDGALFWKITTGRGAMAGYENILSEKERWALVQYIRSFNKNNTPVKYRKPVVTVPKASTKHIQIFPFDKAVNLNTTTLIPAKQWSFIIQHRFGAIKADEGIWRNFLGLDLASNIRVAAVFKIGKNLQAEIGRTRYGKFYDLGLKYKIVEQNELVPLDWVVYENVAISTEKAPVIPEGTTFENGEPFTYTFAHRLSYDTQLLLARKFNRFISAQTGFELIWRNLAPPGEANFTPAIPFIIRLKTGFMSAVSIEYSFVFRKRTRPWALAYEIASSGKHVFQITLSNSDRILPQNLYTHNSFRPGKEGLSLGFNLIRFF